MTPQRILALTPPLSCRGFYSQHLAESIGAALLCETSLFSYFKNSPDH